MSILRFHGLVSFNYHNIYLKLTNSPFSLIASLSSLSLGDTCSSTSHTNLENHVLFRFLTDSLNFQKQKALTIAGRFSYIISPDKPQSVVQLLKNHGFLDTQIKALICSQPQILLSDAKKILGPKLIYFQGLGLQRHHLGMCISKNPTLLTSSLNKRLKPCLELIKETLEINRDYANSSIADDMFRVLSRYSWGMSKTSRLLSNIRYLEKCGVVGSQLVMLLKNEPRIISLPEAELESLVSRATDSGFLMGSRMLIYGVLACYSNSVEIFSRKYNLLESFGFSKYECAKIFIKTPFLLKLSEERLRRSIEFFLYTLIVDKSVVVSWPNCLMFSMEKRVIPRCRVLKIINSRKLLKTLPRITTLLCVPEKDFMQKYILRFDDDAKDLLLAYEGRCSDSSEV